MLLKLQSNESENLSLVRLFAHDLLRPKPMQKQLWSGRGSRCRSYSPHNHHANVLGISTKKTKKTTKKMKANQPTPLLLLLLLARHEPPPLPLHNPVRLVTLLDTSKYTNLSLTFSHLNLT